MGLFDKLFGGGAGRSETAAGPQPFYWGDDAQKLAKCWEAGQRMAPAIGGTVTLREKNEVDVTGRFGPFAVRVEIWAEFGAPRIRMRPEGGLRLSLAGLHLEFDDQPSAAGGPVAPDGWGGEAEQKLHFSPRVCMKGRRETLTQAKALWDQLPATPRGQLLQLLESGEYPGSFFRVGSDELELYLNSTQMTLSNDAASWLHFVLQLLADLAAHPASFAAAPATASATEDTSPGAVTPGSAVTIDVCIDPQGRLVARQPGRPELEVSVGNSVVIGRAADCALCLERPEVSRKHARLSRQDGGWCVQDFGSTYGLYLRRGGAAPARVDKVAPLVSGDVVYVGGYALVFRLL